MKTNTLLIAGGLTLFGLGAGLLLMTNPAIIEGLKSSIVGSTYNTRAISATIGSLPTGGFKEKTAFYFGGTQFPRNSRVSVSLLNLQESGSTNGTMLHSSDGRWYAKFNTGMNAGNYRIVVRDGSVSSGNILTSKDIVIGTPKPVAIVPSPTVTITAYPITIASGATSIISWSGSNVASCTLNIAPLSGNSSGWMGTDSSKKSMTMKPMVNTTYTVTCSQANTGKVIVGRVTVGVTLPVVMTEGTATGAIIGPLPNGGFKENTAFYFGGTRLPKTSKVIVSMKNINDSTRTNGTMLHSADGRWYARFLTGLPVGNYLIEVRDGSASNGTVLASKNLVIGGTTSVVTTPTIPLPTVTSSFSPTSIPANGSTLYTYSSSGTTHCVTTHPDGTATWDNVAVNASYAPYRYYASQFPNGMETTQTCYNAAGQSVTSTARVIVSPLIASGSKLNIIYNIFLRRNTDAPGESYYNNLVTTQGYTNSKVAWELLASSEGKDTHGVDITTMGVPDYVRFLYTIILGRSMNTGDGTYWIDQINSGVTRQTTLAGILNSVESRNKYPTALFANEPSGGTVGSTGSTTIITPTIGTCSGALPTDLSGVSTFGSQQNNTTPGAVTLGTIWAYAGDTQNYGCTWSCKVGYKRNENTGCIALAPGEGLTIEVLDKNTKQPISGVAIEFIQSLSIAGSSVLLNGTTDSSGKIPESFVDIPDMPIIHVKKTGYAISSSSLSEPDGEYIRFNYRTLTAATHKVTIYMTTGAVVTPGGNLSQTIRIDKDPSRPTNYGLFYGTIAGTDVNNTTGCAEAESSTVCENTVNTWENLLTRASNPWSVLNGKLVGEYPLSFTNGIYRMWVKNKTTNEVKNTLITIGGTPQSAGSTVSVTDESQSNGLNITRLKQTIYGGYSHLMACTGLAYDASGIRNSNCNPTTDLQDGIDGWSFDGITNTYNIDNTSTTTSFPYARYRSCFKPVDGSIQCQDFVPKLSGSNEVGCSFGSVAGPTNPGACTKKNNGWVVDGYTCRCN